MERLFGGLALDCAQYFLDRLQRQRRYLRHLRRPFPRSRQQLVRRHDAVDEPVVHGFGGRHASSQVKHFERDIIGQAFWQPLHRAGVGYQSERQFRQRELDVFGGDDEVAGKRYFEAAAKGEPIQRGDDRLVQIPHFGDAGKSAQFGILGLPPVFQRRVTTVERLQVPAGAEYLFPGAGNDGDLQIGVVAKVNEGLAQLAAGGQVDGIGLGAIDGDQHHRFVARYPDFVVTWNHFWLPL